MLHLTCVLHVAQTKLSNSSIQLKGKRFRVHGKTWRLVIVILCHHPVEVWGMRVKELHAKQGVYIDTKTYIRNK